MPEHYLHVYGRGRAKRESSEAYPTRVAAEKASRQLPPRTSFLISTMSAEELATKAAQLTIYLAAKREVTKLAASRRRRADG